MNGVDYDPLLKQYEKETTDGKLNCLCTMFEMLVTNHLPHIERGQRHIERGQKLNRKWLFIIGGTIMLGLLFSDQISMTSIMGLLIKVV